MVKFLLQATEVNYEPPASTLLVLLSGNSLVRPSYEGCLSIRKMTLETRCSRTAQLLHHTLGTHCHLDRKPPFPLLIKCKTYAYFVRTARQNASKKSVTEGIRFMSAFYVLLEFSYKLTYLRLASTAWAAAYGEQGLPLLSSSGLNARRPSTSVISQTSVSSKICNSTPFKWNHRSKPWGIISDFDTLARRRTIWRWI